MNKIIYPFIAAVLPIAVIFHNNLFFIPEHQLIVPLLIVLLFQSLMLSLWFLITKDWHKSALVSTVFIIAIFGLKGIAEFCLYGLGLYRTPVGRVRYIALLILLFFILFSLFLRVRKTSFHVLTRILNVGFIAIACIVSARILYKYASYSPSLVIDYPDDAPPYISHEELPDIHYIIPDGYPSARTLKTVFSYDNSDLLAFLRKKGFYIADSSTSNYTQTQLSIASSMNMTYLDEFVKVLGKESQEFYPLTLAIQHSRVRRFLTGLGYTFVSFASGYHKTEITDADIYLQREGAISEFHRVLLTATCLDQILIRINPEWINFSKKDIEYTLNTMVELKHTNPLFVFAHISCPHEPFEFCWETEAIAVCENKVITSEYLENYKECLRNEITHLNAYIKKAVESLLKRDKNNTIIIIQSDHGANLCYYDESFDVYSMDPTQSQLRQRMENLTAIYLPENKYENLYKTITPVNIFRVIFDSVFGTDFGHLPDKNFYSTIYFPLDFKDVTPLVK